MKRSSFRCGCRRCGGGGKTPPHRAALRSENFQKTNDAKGFLNLTVRIKEKKSPASGSHSLCHRQQRAEYCTGNTRNRGELDCEFGRAFGEQAFYPLA